MGCFVLEENQIRHQIAKLATEMHFSSHHQLGNNGQQQNDNCDDVPQTHPIH